MINPDIEAIISFLTIDEGGRTSPVSSGYRPGHLVKEDYLTTGEHYYLDKIEVGPGQSVLGNIKFISPEAYPNCLHEGKIISIQEGSRVVGYAKVTKIFNDLLRCKP